MRSVVFNGLGLTGSELYGIQRNTLEILKELDHMVEPGIVKVIIAEKGNSLNFENIEVLQFGKEWGRTRNTSLNKTLNMAYRYIVKNIQIPLYVKSSHSISVDMLLGFPFVGSDIVSVYDCIPELFPENYTSFLSKYRRKRLLRRQKRGLKKAKLILTDSNSAKNDICKIYNCSKDKVVVLTCGWQHFKRVNEDRSILEKYNLKDRMYYFSLGSRLLHKNAKWVLAAAKQNVKDVFVITGSELHRTDKEKEKNKSTNVIFTGYLSDGQVKALMHYCKAFLQPSLYEGFGIPPMEAMSVGANCIVSNVSSLPEIYGDSVWYIDPLKYDDIDLNRIMAQGINGSQQILDKFSWEKSANKLKTILETFS